MANDKSSFRGKGFLDKVGKTKKTKIKGIDLVEE